VKFHPRFTKSELAINAVFSRVPALAPGKMYKRDTFEFFWALHSELVRAGGMYFKTRDNEETGQ